VRFYFAGKITQKYSNIVLELFGYIPQTGHSKKVTEFCNLTLFGIEI